MYRLLFFILFFVSCSTLPVVESSLITTEKTLISQFQTQKDTNIRFHVSNDESKLNIEFLIDKQQTAVMIVMQGLKIYLDKENEESKDTYLIYPYRDLEDGSLNGENDRRKEKGQFGKKWDLNSIEFKNEMIWHQEEIDNYIYLNGNKENFEGNIKVLDGGELYYRISVPINKLIMDKTATENISVGFSLEPPKFKPQMRENPNPENAGPGGGMPGGGMPRGGRPGGGIPGEMKQPEINFWFSVKLAKNLN